MRAAGQRNLRTSSVMSGRDRSSLAKARRLHAPVFAALGDETRLALVAKLCEGPPQSISRLTEGSHLNRLAKARRLHAPVFAALGDETRLALVAKLCEGPPQSISRLTEGSHLTRQA